MISETNPIKDDGLWYKDAVIYQLHVKSFFDSNDDGVGDVPGLIMKLDYIASLGVNTIWLLPFYPSPRRDDGYDIADYRGVHPDYGTVADVRKLIREAHARGLRVITELVVNHTSDQHRWFQRARTSRPGSAARNFYVWSDNDKAYAGTRIIFCDTEKSNWTWDPEANAYFWHRFYSHQPDLNYDNPQVLKEVLSVMRYWLDMGVDGLRLDAVPYLVEREGTNNENLPETHQVLKQIRAVIDEEYPGRLLLAEANQWPEDAQEYFGAGDECHMSFHFPLMPRMYMAIAQEDRFPITDIIRQTPDIPDTCQWAIFLRNHDELTLEMVTSRERDYLWSVYAADPRARINLGIRRRLAPLLERDRRRVELMNSLLLSMPGTPVLYYGDELGMGDNVHLGDRDGVRTPMQWSPDRNGGFSRADPERLPLPVLMGPLYGYEAVNVEAQQRDPHSLLNWTRRMLAQRRQTHAFGRGTLRFIQAGNRKILAYLRQWNDTTILCVANLSNAAQPVELPLQEFNGRVPVEMLGGTPFPAIGELPYLLTLPPYGFYWMDLSLEAAPPGWHASGPAQMPELTTLVLKSRGGAALTDASRNVLENEVLPEYLARQRWFPGSKAPSRARLAYATPFSGAAAGAATGGEFYWAEVEPQDGIEDGLSVQAPFVLVWDETAQVQYPIARVRRGAEVGVLADAFLQPGFVLGVIDALRTGQELDGREGGKPGDKPGVIRYLPEPGLSELDFGAEPALQWIRAEQSNSSVIVGNLAILKLIRNVKPGVSPEVEVSRHLTRAGYANVPALLGEVLRVDADGVPHTLAVLHAFVNNEGDAWTWTLDFLKRTLGAALLGGDSPEEFEASLEGYTVMATTIGRRLAELHNALAQPTDDPAFPVQTATEEDAQAHATRIIAQLDRAEQDLRAASNRLEAPSHACAEWLFEHHARLVKQVSMMAQALEGAPLIRVHGDFHLGQVLVAQTDAYLIDFEGEPIQTLEARRNVTTPYKDVAGMLRSFDYAAASVARSDPMGGAPTDANAGAADSPAAPGVPQDLRDTLLARFGSRAVEAFLQGYQEAASTAIALPGAQEDTLLKLAQLEKAAYEVSYEAAHRPDWISIPLCALTSLARELLQDAAISAEEKNTMNRTDNGGMPPSSTPAGQVDAATLHALAGGQHADPFAVLGPHDGVVRALLPGALAVAVVSPDGTRAPLHEQAQGLFTGAAPEARPGDPGSYQLAIQWPGSEQLTPDPYAFGPVLSDADLAGLASGDWRAALDLLGARLVEMNGVSGLRCAVWAPNARRVAVVGDFNSWDSRRHPMRLRHAAGVWELFIPGVCAGDCYKFAITDTTGAIVFKADPMARRAQAAPATASVVDDPTPHVWTDEDWMRARGERQQPRAPISIYEVQAGSWIAPDNERCVWDQLAEKLPAYAHAMGFTHVELMPIMEYPFGGSWGYQPLGMFAPSARFGPPEAFARFVDRCHAVGVGVILDWVPAHFPNDAHGLARFDGTPLYEYADPREGYHPDWNTLVYNLGRTEVKAFMIASAVHWLRQFHIDGLRVDAVASMLYRDYSRQPGEWIPNVYGGRENLEAVAFLRDLNTTVRQEAPDAIVVAEESTAWPGVTAPVVEGGLGFHYKWNMGWMHDTLRYMHEDPVYRKYHHHDITFGMAYAYSERFILPLSHDEVVHGKGSLLNKMPGDHGTKLANLRAYLGFMWAHPGKKLLFMGGELAQPAEWNHDATINWSLLDDAGHKGVQRLVADLNRVYRESPAMHELDDQPDGFAWLVMDDADNSVAAFLRRSGASTMLAVCNFTPVTRHAYRVGVPLAGRWAETLNTDAGWYGGSGQGNQGAAQSTEQAAHGHAQSLSLTLPPLATLFFTHEG